MEEQEDESTLDILSKDLLKWEKQIIISPQSQNPSSNGWSMVIIKDYQESSLIFPPTHHENLHLKPSLFTDEVQKLHCESFTPSLSSSSSSTVSTLSSENEAESNDSPTIPLSPMGCCNMGDLESPALSPKQIAMPAAGVMDWVYFGLEVLIRKVKRVLHLLLSPSKAAFTAVMVLGYLYFRRRRRPVVWEESTEHFNRIVREKDERISHLLNQIARMNEVMLAPPRNSTIKN